jgi:hypothetical protein
VVNYAKHLSVGSGLTAIRWMAGHFQRSHNKSKRGSPQTVSKLRASRHQPTNSRPALTRLGTEDAVNLELAGPGGLTPDGGSKQSRAKTDRNAGAVSRQMARKSRVSAALRLGVAGFTMRGRDDEEFRFKRGVVGVKCRRDSRAKSEMSADRCRAADQVSSIGNLG